MASKAPAVALDRIPISALNQFSYCPRRCFLIHVEGEFTDNIHTVKGTLEHERVDRSCHETQQGVRVEYAMPVCSERLGLSGRCDVVEFHADGTIYPVEYKHGKRKRWENDDIQLAAQAFCLEEMMGGVIREGAIFHSQSRRRRVVHIDDTLRTRTTEVISQVHRLLQQEIMPPPTDQRQRCDQCSLRTVCQPELHWDEKPLNLHRMAQELFAPEDDRWP
jgi:CRISPR-associated exonuclease Cas4